MAKTKEKLLKERQKYFEDVSEWFLAEATNWSKKYNMYVSDYVYLEVWIIGNDEKYRPDQPYSVEGGRIQYCEDPDLDEQFKEAINEYNEKIHNNLLELGYTCWQGLEYSDKHKFIG